MRLPPSYTHLRVEGLNSTNTVLTTTSPITI